MTTGTDMNTLDAPTDSAEDQIEPSMETLGNLFVPGIDKCFIIPQYQRDYSWNNKNKNHQVEQFFTDIVDRLQFRNDNGSIRPICQSYFVGTMIFKGIWNINSGSLEVIDGQQRLTTTYLFLGALSNRFADTANDIQNQIAAILGSDNPSQKWEDLISQYRNYGKAIRDDRLRTPKTPYKNHTDCRLKIETGEDVMNTLIFKDQAAAKCLKPKCEAEKNLIEAYKYIYTNLGIESLANNPTFNELLSFPDDEDGHIGVENLYQKYSNYSTILYGIREQLCTPAVAILSTRSEKQSNEIFESLNSKGKELEPVDLIKNNIFERITKNPPYEAYELWGSIKQCLSAYDPKSGSIADTWVNLEQFFYLFWIAVEDPKVGRNKLYDDYKDTYDQASKTELKEILERAVDFAPDVSALYNTDLLQRGEIPRDYLEHAKEGIHYLVKIQVAKQSFPLLASALHACRKKALKPAVLIELIDYLAVAFLFLTFRNIRGSKYTGILQDTAHCLANCARKGYLDESLRNEMTAWYIRNLEDEISDIIGKISDEDIEEMIHADGGFEYSNNDEDNTSRAKVRYLLRIRCYRKILDQKDKGARTESSFTWNVEHILPDSKEQHSITHQLGNLIWLDKATNDECKDKKVIDKIKIYQEKAANPEIAEMTDFFRDLCGDEEQQKNAIEKRSRRILYELYSEVVKKSSTRDSSGREIPKQRANPYYKDRLDHFINAKGKRYQFDIAKNHWFHTFASEFVCESESEDDERHIIPLPNTKPFTLPLIRLTRKSGINKIDDLIKYVNTQLNNNCTFRRIGKQSQSQKNLGAYIIKMLETYKSYLLLDEN